LSYEQIKDASAPSMYIHTSDLSSAVKYAWSELIQAREISVEEFIKKLKDEAKEILLRVKLVGHLRKWNKMIKGDMG